MSKQQDIWLKAAVIGSLWGASEIVLGSFLHNLRIPFSGNILTSIGIIVMVAGHRLWPQRGILIRAGLICAALKTLSPSHVLLGPMLSIMMQATLMEAATSVGKKSYIGYMVGGGLAVSWNLLHRILSAIVLYGSSLIALYQNLIDFFINQTGWDTDGYWIPLTVLWGIFFLWGAAAGIAGILVSKAAANTEHTMDITYEKPTAANNFIQKGRTSGWLLIRPAGILALLVAGLYSVSSLPPVYKPVFLSVFLFATSLYNRMVVYRFLKKRGLWVGISIMVLLSGFLMGPNHGFSGEGVIAGLEMAMRAVYVVVGFGIISSELKKPEMASLFSGKKMAPFLSAVRVAFQTTPILLDHIPVKKAWRHPGRVLASMVGGMEHSLNQLRMHQKEKIKAFVVSGVKGIGKTSLTRKVVEFIRQAGYQPEGILAPAVVENGRRVGYMVQRIGSGEKMVLCKKQPQQNKKLPGEYIFNQKAIRFGEKLLTPGSLNKKDLLVIDELGPYELKGMGWDTIFKEVLTYWDKPVVLVVRESLIDNMAERYGLNITAIFHADKTTAQTVAEYVIRCLKNEGADSASNTW